jgi:hypothetical protein
MVNERLLMFTSLGGCSWPTGVISARPINGSYRPTPDIGRSRKRQLKSLEAVIPNPAAEQCSDPSGGQMRDAATSIT